MKAKTGYYHKIKIDWHNPGESIHSELVDSAADIIDLFILRDFYQRRKSYSDKLSQPQSSPQNIKLNFKDGIFYPDNLPKPVLKLTITDFFSDLQKVNNLVNKGPLSSFSHTRLEILHKLFDLYKTTSWKLEYEDLKKNSPDFTEVTKIDNHIHVTAAMGVSTLIKFIKNKLETSPDMIINEEGTTLKELLEENGLDASNLNINKIFARAPKEMFKRFDIFNEEYNLFGKKTFRKLFLEYDNFIKGKFLAEILQIELNKAQQRNSINEYHISIYGRKPEELKNLADFMINNSLIQHNVRWIIQVPRIFSHYTELNITFSELFYNIFKLFFEASLNPQDPANKNMSTFLESVVAFDSVDDESSLDELYNKELIDPNKITTKTKQKIPYSHYLYYMYENITQLNNLRKSKGLNTFALRPHAGEAGRVHHLSTCFLLADTINHGIKLNDNPVLFYLYYLKQIGCSVALSSNNYLFKSFPKNPFKKFFEVGLNVTLSTDDPLQFHLTGEPLIEEYALARQYYKFSDCDILEIAKNSIRQSGLKFEDKEKHLGKGFKNGRFAEYPTRITGVSSCRYRYRGDTLFEELKFLFLAAGKKDGKCKLKRKLIVDVDNNEFDWKEEAEKFSKLNTGKELNIEIKKGEVFEVVGDLGNDYYIVLNGDQEIIVSENWGSCYAVIE